MSLDINTTIIIDKDNIKDNIKVNQDYNQNNQNINNMQAKIINQDLSDIVFKNRVIDKSAEPDIPLQNTWILWHHDVNSDDWSLDSYQKIYEFNTIQDFWRLYNNLPSIVNSMFFLMKKNYPPIWEAPQNINGGAWLFKFPKKMGDCYWLKFSCYLVGETFANNTDDIIGLSLSSKSKNFNVTIAVWNKNSASCRDNLNFNQDYQELTRGAPLYKEFKTPDIIGPRDSH